MADYTPQVDTYIAQQLHLRGSVSADQIPGVSYEDGLVFLREFVRRNPDDPLYLDAGLLSTRPDLGPEAPPSGSSSMGFQDAVSDPNRPMPQAYAPAAPAATGRASGYADPPGAGSSGGSRFIMLIGGMALVVAVVAALSFFFLSDIDADESSTRDWPAGGQLTFYYFGRPG